MGGTPLDNAVQDGQAVAIEGQPAGGEVAQDLGQETVVEPVGGTPVLTWDLDEPSERGIEGMDRMRLVRDEIAERVTALARDLTSGTTAGNSPPRA